MSRGSQRWTKFAAGKGLACATLCAVLAGCSSGPSLDATQALNPDPPAKMFADADALMASGSFAKAADKFEAVDREHPYAPEARRAMVMAAYAYYRAGKTPEAIATAERYVALHPGTKEAPLAHHIIASSYFDEMKGPNRTSSQHARRWNSSRHSKPAIPIANTRKTPTSASASRKTILPRARWKSGATI